MQSKFNPKIADTIVYMVELGFTEEAACRHKDVDISPRTLRNWKTKGRENPESPESEFLKRLKEADGKTLLEIEAKGKRMARAGHTDLIKYFLTKRDPRYADEMKITLQATEHALSWIEGIRDKVPSEVYAAILESIAERAGVSVEELAQYSNPAVQ